MFCHINSVEAMQRKVVKFVVNRVINVKWNDKFLRSQRYGKIYKEYVCAVVLQHISSNNVSVNIITSVVPMNVMLIVIMQTKNLKF